MLALATLSNPFCSIAEEPSRPSSVYTDLSGSRCAAVTEDKETGASVHRCPGVNGWTLLVAYDDERMSITVVEPNGAEHALNYWDVITNGFSSLGTKAEWRVRRPNGRVEPIALIVRVNGSELREDGSRKPTSYLAVATIDRERICVTNKINATPDANQRARQAADKSAVEPCLQH